MEGLTLRQNTKRTAPPELLQQIKATIPKKAGEPYTSSEILRRAKGGCMRRCCRGRWELNAKFRKGVLTVTLPKTAKAQASAKHIAISKDK
ncbi:hypothetical protein [Phyllobacterium sp. LjRoot231]|uniref:hypothetical protein n=1 Tax=Phyllobacterium sp. LjRoot231 TaxID=3342289 RepID=UPI003F50B41C